MAYMVILILAQAEELDAVLDAWRAVGIDDVTIFQSKNLAEITDRCRRDDLPLFPSMNDIFENEEFNHYTLFTVVQQETQIDDLIAAAEQQIGDLNDPGNGALVALPVARMKGMRGNTKD